MKMLHKILGCSTVAAALALTSGQAQNLLVNPGFDDVGGFTANPITVSGIGQGWALFDTATTDDMVNNPNQSPLSGSTAMLETLAQGNGWETPGAYQVVNVIPGDQYVFSAWATSTTGSATGGSILQLSFLPPDLSGNPTTVENPWTGQYNGSGMGAAGGIPSTTQWVQYTTPAVTPPAGYTEAIVYLMYQDNNAPEQENIWYDNASLVDVTPAPEPTTLALAGLGGVSLLSLIRRRKS